MGPIRNSKKGPCVLHTSSSRPSTSRLNIPSLARNVILQSKAASHRLRQVTTHSIVTQDDIPELVEIEDSNDEFVDDDEGDMPGIDGDSNIVAGKQETPKKPPVSTNFYIQHVITHSVA